MSDPSQISIDLPAEDQKTEKLTETNTTDQNIDKIFNNQKKDPEEILQSFAEHSFKNSTNPIKKKKKNEEVCTTLSPDTQELLNELINLSKKNQIIKDTYEWLLNESGYDDQKIQTTLSRWIYLTDKCSQKTNQKIIDAAPELRIQTLNQNYEAAFKKELDKLTLLYHQYNQNGILPASFVIRAQTPRFIAETLITSKGHLNYGLIPHLLEIFLEDEFPQINYSMNIDFGLSLLLQTKSLRKMITKIKAPARRDHLIVPIIQATLSLPESKKLRSRDARIAVLSAFLSHPRQGIEGNCFSQYLANVLLLTNPKLSLKDFRSLVEHSCLVRTIEETDEVLPFLPTPTNSFLKKKIRITKGGQWIQSRKQSNPLWNDLSLLTVCQKLKIKTPKKALKSVCQKLSPEQTSCTITVSQLLTGLAHYAHQEQETEKNLNLLAKLTFSSLVDNPLQNVWISAIANGAESKLYGTLKHCMKDSVSQTIKNRLSHETGRAQIISNELISTLDHQIEERFRIYYDGSISSGSFVLFLFDFKSRSKIRVDQPVLFQRAMLQLLKEGKNSLSKKNRLHLRYLHSLQSTYNQLKKYIQSEQFLLDSVAAYQYVSPFANGDPLQYRNLPFTPWVNHAVGHDAAHILQVYFELDNQPESLHIQPKNASELFQSLLKYIQIDCGKIQKDILNNPYFLAPTRIVDKHAFGLTLSHPSLTPFWENEIQIDEYFYDEALFTKKVQEDLLKWIAEKEKTSVEEIKEQISTQKSFKKFRKDAIKYLQIDSNVLDQKLWSLLPKKNRRAYSAKFIHIADTNWRESKGISDVHYAIGKNPFTDKLELFEINDNNKNLKFLLQEAFFPKTWEFYKQPEIFLT